jgi:hypothetical protein
MIKADLHNHLGKNGANPGFDETIDLVYNKRGPNFIFGICNCTSVDYRFENFANQKGGKYERIWLDDEKRILSVPEKQIYIVGAEEVVTKQGHLVVAGMPSNKKIQKDNKSLSLEDALKSAGDFRGIKIAVHPFGREGISEYIREHILLSAMLDGWEIYNASADLAVPGVLPFNANEKSAEFYNFCLKNDYNLGACAFTDGHSPEVIGRSYSEYCCINRDNLLMSLRQRIRQNQDFDNLHMEPAKLDAFKHAVNMAKQRLFKAGA